MLINVKLAICILCADCLEIEACFSAPIITSV